MAFWLFILLAIVERATATPATKNAAVQVDIGVILDKESLLGKKSTTSISMAIEDFYAAHPNYSTRVVLHFRDSQNDVVQAAAAASDLITNVQAQTIIGALTSTQNNFVTNLCTKTRTPFLSFTTASPTITPYFICTTLADNSQLPAITALVQHFNFHQAVLVYEDSDYGTGIIPCLLESLQSVNAVMRYRSVILPSASDEDLDIELQKLKSIQSRVFIVHMLPSLAFRLFKRVKAAGMMTEGYVWITTDAITNVVDQSKKTVIDAMQGVIGVRPYVKHTAEIKQFTSRFKRRFGSDYPGTRPPEPTFYQLWAYDTAWAIAAAVEKTSVGKDRSGPELLDALLKTKFKGLAGEFKLVDQQLKLLGYEIVNVNGKSIRTVGFWTAKNGLSTSLNSSISKGLLPVIWPGNGADTPKGWEVPVKGKSLRVGVPVKKGFKEFVNVTNDSPTCGKKPTGYCIDVFEYALAVMPYSVPVDYCAYGDSSESYDEMVNQVYQQNFDAVVGDVTILLNRTPNVDFTLPYTMSGVSMIVPVKQNEGTNLWIFLKPLTLDLWLATLAFFIFNGFVVWAIEHPDNTEFKGTVSQQLGTIFYFTFSVLVFAHKEQLKSNLTRVVMIIWVFVVLILTSSYTASLTSMLTVQQLQPTVTDVKELLKSKANVGYQDGSFVKGLLVNKLGFDEGKLRNYSTAEQYAEALWKGSANGGVDALFDEIPYLKVFLSNPQYCSDFIIVGQTYKTDGFGFVFPRDSPLVPDVSRSILNVTEGEKMIDIERKWFGDSTSCASQSYNVSSSSLSFESFRGLFLITGVVSTTALLVFLARFIYVEWDQLKKAAEAENSVWRKIVALYKHYHDRPGHSAAPTFKKDGSNGFLHLVDKSWHGYGQGEAQVSSQSPVSMSNYSDIQLGSVDSDLSST